MTAREHQVVVVFDVTADSVLDAGRHVADFINRSQESWAAGGGRPAIESWWMPEEPLRSEVCHNDNGAMHLEPTSPPNDVYVEDDAEDTPTIWLHRHDATDRPVALLNPYNLGRQGRELLWDHIVRGLPNSAPVPA